MEIGATGEHLAMDNHIVKKKDKSTVFDRYSKKNVKESSNILESGEETKRARGVIMRMRDDARKKYLEKEKERAKEKLNRKSQEAQLLAKAKIADFKKSAERKT